ncbi:MAG TPA: hypothetical protein VF015_03250, partial [Acidimicrobiales bacterium]
WWCQLAADGQRVPAAAIVAVMTADRARALSQRQRRAARAAERQRRDGARAVRRQRRAVAAAAGARPRYAPLPRAQSGVRRGWVLAVMLAALALYLWSVRSFGDALVAHYRVVDPGSAATADKLSTYREVSGSAGLAGLLLVALPAVHVATRAAVRRGARRGAIRVYAGAAAGLDLLLGLTLVPAATMAGLVLGAGIEAALDPTVAAPFGADEPWAAVGLLVPFGLVGLVLIVRSVWRLARVAFGRPVAGRAMPPPAPLPG